MHEKVKSHTQDYRNRSTDSTSTLLTLNTIFTVYSDDQYSPSSATRRIRTLQFESKTSNNDRYYAIPRSKLAHMLNRISTSADYVDLDNIEPLAVPRTVKLSLIIKLKINVSMSARSNTPSQNPVDYLMVMSQNHYPMVDTFMYHSIDMIGMVILTGLIHSTYMLVQHIRCQQVTQVIL